LVAEGLTARSNNKVERLHNTVRERVKVMRGLHSEKSAAVFNDGFKTYYNFVRQNQALKGLTPAEVAGVDLKLGENKLLGLAKNAPTWKKMYHYFEFRNEEFLQHYHKRSNAETTFHMIKSKFGDSVRSKTEVAQVNEVLLKVLCHNICVVIQEMFELGIEPTFFSA
jgi:hypothetical protein